jgi:hypothetical protein
MVLEYCVAHRIPCIISGGLDGDAFPAGCFALIGFATDNISIDPGRLGAAMLSLCTARTGVPKRRPAEIHANALFQFRPSNLPPAIFAALRAHDCAVNRSVPFKWNTARTSIAVHICELWHVLTSQQKCTRFWFEAHPRFVDLKGFLDIPVYPHPGPFLTAASDNPSLLPAVRAIPAPIHVIFYARTCTFRSCCNCRWLYPLATATGGN